MFVCLCTGTTSHVVSDVVANGAKTSKQIAEACGAGGDCGYDEAHDIGAS